MSPAACRWLKHAPPHCVRWGRRSAEGGVPRRARPRASRQPSQDSASRCARSGRAPGFSAVAILSLALGIGANTTIFTFVNAVLLRPLPYPGSDRLVVLREQPLASAAIGRRPSAELRRMAVPARVRSRRSRCANASAQHDRRATAPSRLRGLQTTSELFRVFGRGARVGPHVHGRGDTAGPARRRRHSGSRLLAAVVWRRPRCPRTKPGGPRGGSLTIVGVAPAAVSNRRDGARRRTRRCGSIRQTRPRPASRSFQCYGRLKPGVSLDAARAEMTVIASALARQYPPLDKGMGVFVSGLHEYLVREGRPALRLLMAVVATVLVIACVNLAGLLMARGMGRRGELALRASLGASRGRLVRQLVIESLVLAMFGGAAGLVLAYWATQRSWRCTAGALTVGQRRADPSRCDLPGLHARGVHHHRARLRARAAWQASRVEPQAALREQTPRWHRRSSSPSDERPARRDGGRARGRAARRRRPAAADVLDPGPRRSSASSPAETITMGLFLGVRPPEVRVAPSIRFSIASSRCRA